jgi:OPA family glycerol-3-phosphate transporter-like MFS transporter
MNPLNWLMAAKDSQEKVSAENVKSTYLKKQTGVLLATSIGYIGYYIIRLVFTTEQTELMNAYGLSKGDIGMVLACFGVGYGISKFFMGTLSDKSNPRYYLATGLFLSAIVNACLGSTSNIYVMMGLMVINAIAQGMGAPACQKSVQVWWSRKYKGTVYAIWSSAHNAGAFCCVAVIQLGGFLFGHDNLPMIFYTASVVSVVIGVVILLLGSDRPTTVGLPSIAEYHKESVVLVSGETVKEDVTHLSLVEIFKKYILFNKAVWAICIVSMSFYIVRYGIMSWIPSYLSEAKGFDKAWAKWFVGIFEIAAVPGVILLGAFSDFIKGRRVVVCMICAVGLIGCILVYALSTDHTAISVALIIMGNLIYTPITLVGLMVNEAVPKFAVGSSTGFMGFFQYIVGEICATAVIGMLVDSYGWTACNIVLVCAAILAFLVLIYLMVYERFKLAELKRIETNS